MNSKPESFLVNSPENTSVVKWMPAVIDYLKFYKLVGNPWGWTGRTNLCPTEVQAIIEDNNTQLYQIKQNDIDAGFVELFFNNNEVEIKYFGILNEFQGTGIGGYFLKWSILKAWEFNPEKITVHTCEFDHPSALAIYQKYGFNIIKSQIDLEFYEDFFLEKRI